MFVENVAASMNVLIRFDTFALKLLLLSLMNSSFPVVCLALRAFDFWCLLRKVVIDGLDWTGEFPDERGHDSMTLTCESDWE
ncbi:hypothetical protein QR685DRAFT_526697 [Neurospora intermedia]|uniref:Uncharacterized protein n=1 Tax=Neurospora intermedia TaxID=5142 RepID=A0ABR3D9X6_NEUIN